MGPDDDLLYIDKESFAGDHADLSEVIDLLNNYAAEEA
jgi:hypothetical protein